MIRRVRKGKIFIFIKDNVERRINPRERKQLICITWQLKIQAKPYAKG